MFPIEPGQGLAPIHGLDDLEALLLENRRSQGLKEEVILRERNLQPGHGAGPGVRAGRVSFAARRRLVRLRLPCEVPSMRAKSNECRP